MSQINPEDEGDLSPVLSTCLYCGGPIEIRIGKKGRLLRLEPGQQHWHLCERPRLRTHTHDKDVFTPMGPLSGTYPTPFRGGTGRRAP